jgi:hemerythrin-like domain-containing protein
MSPQTDPLVRLEHEHTHFTGLVTALHEAVAAAEATGLNAELHAELVEALRSIKDEFFFHFAREEEGLFPLVVADLPDLEPLVVAVTESHDRLSGLIGRMSFLAERGPAELAAEVPSLVALLARFDEAYTAHSQEELALLHALDRRLVHEQRARVARVLREL